MLGVVYKNTLIYVAYFGNNTPIDLAIEQSAWLQELMDCYDNDLGNSFENNAWNLEHDVEKLQEFLNRIM